MSDVAVAVEPQEDIVLPLELGALSTVIDRKPEAIATGDKELQLAALQATKYVFDLALKTESKSRTQIIELLRSLSPSLAPQTRSQTAAQNKRKRNPSPPLYPEFHETPLSELTVDGMGEDQLWSQLELRAKNICDVLEYALEGSGEQEESDEDERDGDVSKKRRHHPLSGDEEDVEMAELEDVDDEYDSEDEEDESSEQDEDGSDDTSEEDGEESEEEDDGEDAELGEGVAELRDPSDEEGSDIDLDKPSFLTGGQRKLKWKPRVGSHPELDDGFFDLAQFNAETEAAEARAVSKGKLGSDEDEDEDDDAEDVDLFAPVDDAAEEEPIGGSDIYYKDFFEPPSKSYKANDKGKGKATGQVRFHEEVRVKKIKAKGKNLPVSLMYQPPSDEDDEDDVEDVNGDFQGYDEDIGSDQQSSDGEESGSQDESDDEGSHAEEESGESIGSGDEEVDAFQSRETIDRLKDDLFAEEDERDPQAGLTTYQRRMAELQEEIAQLEAENVAKKHWTLMGEASSRARPQNALLEEDLEFERVMKAVPVITEETVQGLEERIKQRILDNQFDDVVRKRPVDDKPFLPSRILELQDTKSKQSLAEIYEEEYFAAQAGGLAGEDRDGKLKKEHAEIERLWENICSKLDALSNAHFTPKAPKATISTVANVAAATMESALPTSKATTTMLAPEEVYTPSSSDLQARSELTPAQKRALRNKEKKAKKKARDSLEKSVDKFSKLKGIKGVKQQKDAALKSLVKGGKGVTVVGKKRQALAGNKKS
ncbi:Mpp10 protein [Panus rudis PR-1116 ss-1]|nr:Mpp10 protein [Panus rudis PR-1116 ss-1]